MPANIIKAAAKQTGKTPADLDKVWNKIKNNVMRAEKYKGFPSSRKYSIITKAFMKAVGYKPKAESYVGVFRLAGIDESKIVNFLKEKKARGIVRVDVPEGLPAIVCKVEKPFHIDEAYYGILKSTYFDDNFTSLWSIVDDVCNYNLSQEDRERMSYDEYSLRREQSEASVKAATGLSEEQLEEAKFMKTQDGDGFHVFWSTTYQTTMNFLYALYEQNKEMALRLIREGLIFEYHRYILFDRIAVK